MEKLSFHVSLFFTVLFLSSVKLFGNGNPSPGFIGLRSHYGFIIPHSEKIRSISDSNPWGIELDIGRHFTSDNAWNYCYCYPRAGVMFSYFNFDNPDILGNAYTITPYIEPFFSAHRRFSSSVKTGIGLVYLNNIYDPVTNPLNHFYSTKFCFLLVLNYNLNYRVNDLINLRLALNYNHISNGGNRQPNKGINYPTVGLGIDYSLTSPNFMVRSKDEYREEDQNDGVFRLSLFFTSKEIHDTDDTQYPVFGFATKYSYLVGRLSAVTGGFELVSDGSIRQRLKEANIEDSDHRRFSAFLGHELLIGKFNFYQELGYYLYSPFKAKDPVYQRWGLEFFVKPNISVGVSLKAHRHVADFLDIRLSYGF